MGSPAFRGLNSPSDTPTPGPAGTSPGPGPATLAGAPPESSEPATPQTGQQGGGMAGMLTMAQQTLMKMEAMVNDLSRQFPAAAPSLQQAVEGLRAAGSGFRAALRQINISPGQPEPPAPAIGG